MYPPPAIETSQAELLGTTIGLILTAVVAVAGLAVLIGAVFLADVQPDIRRKRTRHPGRPAKLLQKMRPAASTVRAPGGHQQPPGCPALTNGAS